MNKRFESIVEAVPAIASAIEPFQSEQVQVEVVRALLATMQEQPDAIGENRRTFTDNKPLPQKLNGQSRGKSKRISISLDKNLNLENPGGTSFRDFSNRVSPKNNQEKLLTSVYWLEFERMPETDATVEQVVTCFSHMSWRQPTNPKNALAVVASEKGWLDTSNANDLRVTISGKNHIEYDMGALQSE